MEELSFNELLREMCSVIWEKACSYLLANKTKGLPSTVHLLDRKANVQAVVLAEGRVFDLVQHLLEIKPSTAFILLCEAFGAITPPELNGDRVKVEAWRRGMPDDMADWPKELLFETLVMVGVGRDFTHHQMRDFRRNKKGRVEFLPERGRADGLENRFFKLRELLVREEL